MEAYVHILLIVCPLVLLAGLVDSMAGGGGLISIPAYLFAGLPAHIASGTNKFAMCIGTSISAANFIRAKKVNYVIAVFSILGSLIGSFFGAKFALLISDAALRLILLCILPIVAVTLATRKNLASDEGSHKLISSRKKRLLSFLIGLGIGCYDGLAGPGTGTFLTLAFTGALGLGLVKASGCAKVTNLASNISGLVVYLLGGKVMLSVGIPAAICAVGGNYIGSRLAIKGGAKYIRVVIFIVLGLLFVKTGWDIFSNLNS